ncbi:acylphosphatase [Deferribacter desulfuricans SSM1]|uniref:Acylphosphatase n=1 Tax=Deferribacter desulfuricans (strain DSM 14783 / JCM 11476 / NBRC 101012 / SSM1) TaxID=639282 RepID=D3PBZ5_DEFDS|nr:acylphosphatase [Deferribacter desulfuricans]BAI80118.1 acylphosphatase [Deferribacter desulfuricans SSM1]
MKRLHAIVSGRVQGVGFRAFVYDKALNLNLKGYVKNLPDGTVEVDAEGDEKSLIELLSHLRVGPSLSNVTNIDFEITDKLVNYSDFRIRY